MGFKSKLKIVEELTVSSPCPDPNFVKNAKALAAGWYCNQCSKEVYDLKKLSKKEIAKLIKSRNGQFCAVISRRSDGSLVTKEPVGAAQSFVSAGLLLASTTLITSHAVAQSDVGGVSAPEHQTENNNNRGEVYLRPTESPTPAPTAEPTGSPTVAPEVAIPPPKDSITHTAGGISVPPMRGKVNINPR